MKALLMKRTPVIALACALAATAAIGVGVAQASAADGEASGNIALEERIEGELNDDGIRVDLDDQTEKPAGNISEVNAEETDDLAAAGITDDGIENEAVDAEAKLVAGKKNTASASATNVAEEDYIEVEERAPEDIDEADAEGSSSVSRYIDEDEPAENVVELRGE